MYPFTLNLLFLVSLVLEPSQGCKELNDFNGDPVLDVSLPLSCYSPLYLLLFVSELLVVS